MAGKASDGGSTLQTQPVRQVRIENVHGAREPECVTCGYADYTYSRDMAPRWARNSILSSATRLCGEVRGRKRAAGSHGRPHDARAQGHQGDLQGDVPVLPGLDGGVVPVRQDGPSPRSRGSSAATATGCRSCPAERDAGLGLGTCSQASQGVPHPRITGLRLGACAFAGEAGSFDEGERFDQHPRRFLIHDKDRGQEGRG